MLFAGVATGTWQGTEFCATGVDAPLSSGDLGSPLVDASGSVVGILDAVIGTGAQRTSVFLPAELVQDVAEQIVSQRHGRPRRGWGRFTVPATVDTWGPGPWCSR